MYLQYGYVIFKNGNVFILLEYDIQLSILLSRKKQQNLLASISGNNVPEKVNDNNHNNDTTKLYLCQ